VVGHVFISYSRKDKNFALILRDKLKSRGVSVWGDWYIPKGQNYSRAIDKALSDCTHLILVLSPASVASDEVQSEWITAFNKKKIILPILYQSCEIPYRLNPVEYIDFTSYSPNDEEAIGQILSALGMKEGTHIKSMAQPEQSSENMIEVTNAAVAMIKRSQTEGKVIRMFLAAQDSSGANYGLALGDQEKGDVVFESNGVKIHMSPQDAELLSETIIDYVNDEERGSGFIIRGP
jgi:iron-sulfur cluster assembly protein